MIDIDWSKAPKDATHYRPAKPGWAEVWLKRSGNTWLGLGVIPGPCDSPEWFISLGEYEDVIERPAAWTIEGIPPVGLEVEAYFAHDTKPGWKPFTLKYISDQNIVFKCLHEVAHSRHWFDEYGFKFRAKRTPEQIAAEKRDRVCQLVFEVLDPGCKWHKMSDEVKDRYYAAYANGIFDCADEYLDRVKP